MKNLLKNIINYVVLILILSIIAIPLMWAFSASLTPNEKIFQYTSPFTIRALIPLDITFEAYHHIFVFRNFARILVTTLLLSLATVLVSGSFAFMAGFALARFQFHGKKVLFLLVMFSFMVPVEVIIIPQYIMMLKFGWINTWQGLYIPGLANGMVIFLFRQFFMEIPQSMLDAARVDGTGWSKILTAIVLPLSWPASIGAGLVLFLATWNNYFWPLVVATKPQFRVIQVAISLAVQEQQTFWNELFAGAILAAVIPVLLILPLQRYYIESIASSGTKG